MHRNARLALVVAGRRVVQPFYARTLRVSLPFRAEPNPPTPPLDVASPPESHFPKQPKKRSKTPPPSPKPTGQKPSAVTRKKSKSTQIITRGSKRVRKTKGVSAAHEPLGGTGFIPDNWGKDGASAYCTSECNLFHCIELAPPSPTKRRTASKLRPRKEIVPATSNPSSSRALPPHRIPYVRCTQGYISDQAEKCDNVLRGASRVQSKWRSQKL